MGDFVSLCFLRVLGCVCVLCVFTFRSKMMPLVVIFVVFVGVLVTFVGVLVTFWVESCFCVCGCVFMIVWLAVP